MTAVLNPYLTFNGNCAEAFRFYEHVLGGKIEAIFTFKDSPMAEKVPASHANNVMHASMTIGERVLMGSDTVPQMGPPFEGMKGFSLSLNFATPVEAKKIFDALAEGGQVTMPLQKTFWAEAFGVLQDRFGVPWMINCEPAQ